MTNLMFTDVDGGSILEATSDQPFPVYQDPALSAVGTRANILSLFAQVPGVGAAAAYAQGDAMGTMGQFTGVPNAGVIRDFRWIDYDNEGIDKIVYLFLDRVTLAADNAAFTMADSNLRSIIGVFQFSTWRQVANGQIGLTPNVPCYYNLNGGPMYFAVQTLGTDNIAAGSIPDLNIVIEVAQ